MDGWIDERWMPRWMEGWVGGWTEDEHMCGQIYRMCSWVERTKDGWVDG